MCGRFTLYTDLKILAERFLFDLSDLHDQGGFNPSYNIAPSQQVLVVTQKPNTNENKVAIMTWGLPASWSRAQKGSQSLINARSETVSQKPSFRYSFNSRRCLILADGFYEWKTTSAGKRPVHIQLKESKPFAFAGIWEPGRDNSGNYDPQLMSFCTILTTQANMFMSHIHNRMPVILKRHNEQKWTDQDPTKRTELREIISPISDKYMKSWDVSQFVNSPRNNSPICIKEELRLL